MNFAGKAVCLVKALAHDGRKHGKFSTTNVSLRLGGSPRDASTIPVDLLALEGLNSMSLPAEGI